MIARHVPLILALIIFVGCSDAKQSVTPGPSSAPTVKSNSDPKPKEPTHLAERLALDFIYVIRNDAYSASFSEIRADADLSSQDSGLARQKLKTFIKSQNWNLWFTSINVVDGKEDSVDCYLRGNGGGLLVLLFGYDYDIKHWRLDAYEFPDLTFERPKDESYTDYVTRSIAESRTNATAYTNGAQADGRYFIEYATGKAEQVKGSVAMVRPLEGKRPERGALSQLAESEEKIVAALDLCGRAESFGTKGPDLASAASVLSVAREQLKSSKLSAGLPIAAKKVSQEYKDASITVMTTKQPTLDEIQTILGREDSTEVDEKEKVTWHKYGWCHFGVADMKVSTVRADCNLIRMK